MGNVLQQRKLTGAETMQYLSVFLYMLMGTDQLTMAWWVGQLAALPYFSQLPVVADVVAYLPASQSMQIDASVCPVPLVEYLPAAQSVHAAAPAPEYCPAAHAPEHASWPAWSS